MEVLKENGITYVTGASAAETGFDYQKGGDYFCANGLAIVISERTDGEAGCMVSWKYNDVDYSMNLGPAVTVCGGSWDGEVESANITMTGGTVNNGVFGGGVLASSKVTGDVNISVLGGTLIDGVVGGGACGSVDGNVEIVIGDDEKGPYIQDNIIGGGFMDNANVGGNINITVNNGQIGTGSSSNTAIVAGGGVFGDVAGKVTIDIVDGKVYAIVAGGSMISGDVASVEVNVKGGTVTCVSGGSIDYIMSGDAGKVGTAEINISGGTVTNSVYGGSIRRGDIENSTTVTISGGVVGTEGEADVIIAGSQIGDITGTSTVNIITAGENAPTVTGNVKDADKGLLDGEAPAKIYVNNNFTADAMPDGMVLGINAFADVNAAEAVAEAGAGKMVIEAGAEVVYTKDQYYFLNTNPNEGGENNAFDNVVDADKTYDLDVNGTLKAYQVLMNNAVTTVSSTGKLLAAGEALRIMGGSITVEGNRAENAGAPAEIFTGRWGGGVSAGADTQLQGGYFIVNQEAVAQINDTVMLVHAGFFNVDNATADFSNTYIYLGDGGGYGAVNVSFTNGAEVTFADNTTMVYDKTYTVNPAMNITVDGTSTFTMDASSSITASTLTMADGGKFIINAANFSGYKKVVDLAGTESLEGKVTIEGEGVTAIYGADGDVTLTTADMATVFVNAEYTGEVGADLGNGKFFGVNAFADFESALRAACTNSAVSRIEIESDLVEPNIEYTEYNDIAQKLTIGAAAGKKFTVDLGAHTYGVESVAIRVMGDGASLTIEEGVKFVGLDVVAAGFATTNEEMIINGEVQALSLKVWTNNNGITVNETGKVTLGYGDGQLDLAYGNGFLTVNGTLTDTSNDSLTDGPQFKAGYSGTRGNGNTINLNDTYFEGGAWFTVNSSNGAINMDNSVLKVSGGDGAGSLTVGSSGNEINVDNGSRLIVANVTVGADNKIAVDGSSLEIKNLTNNGVVEVSGESTLKIDTASGSSINLLDGAIVKDSTVGGSAFVAGNVTFRGDNTFAMITDFGTLTDYYGTTAPMAWTVEAGASLTLTNTGRYGLGYGDKVVVNGEIAANGAAAARATLTDDDATNDVKQSLFMHGLVAQESAGWNCDSSFTVNNAFVTIGSNNSFGSKAGNYGGNYTFSFNNSVLNASRITFYNTNAKTTFTLTGSDVELGQFMTRDQDSVFTLDNTNFLSTATSNGTDEGNYNAAELNVTNGSTLTYSAKMFNEATGVINVDNATFVAPEVENSNEFNVSGESTLDIAKFVGNDIVASGVLKDSKLTMDEFDWETGNVMVDGELEVQNGTFSKVQFRADEGEKVTISGKVVAAGATQFKAVNGEVVLDGEFTSDVSEASSIELEGDDAKLTVEKDSKAKITGGFYLNGGTATITGNLAEDADLAALTREDAQIDAAYSTWGGTYAADVTLTDTYVWNAMISTNNADTVVTVDNSLLVGWMSFDINAGTLIATNGGLVNHQGAEGWTWSTIGADGALVVEKGSTFNAAKTNLTNNGSITVDGLSSFIANTIIWGDNATITIDGTNFAGGVKKIIDLNGTESLAGKVTIKGEGITAIYGEDGDVTITDATSNALYVNTAWAGSADNAALGDGKVFGFNAFAHIADAIRAAAANSAVDTITVEAGSSAELYTFAVNNEIVTSNPNGLVVNMGNNGVSFNTAGQTTVNGVVVDSDDETPSSAILGKVTIGENVKVIADQLAVDPFSTANINGELDINGAYLYGGAVEVAGKLNVNDNFVMQGGGYGTSPALDVEKDGSFDAVNVYAMGGDAAINVAGNAKIGKLESDGTVTIASTGVLDIENSLVADKLVNASALAIDYTAEVNDLVNTGIVDVNGGSLEVADNMDFYGNFKLSGLTAGEARTITVAFMPEGATEGGFTKQINVAANATSVNVNFTDVVDGKYNLTVIDGTNVQTATTEINNGKLTVNGGSVSVGTLTINKGAATVTGASTLNINKVANGFIKVLDGANISDSYIGGKVRLDTGKSTWSGKNTVTGDFSAGYNNYGGDLAVDITGEFTNSNFLIWAQDGNKTVVNIGSADAAKTQYNGGTIGEFENSEVNVVNADVVYSYTYIRGDFNVTDSTMTIQNGYNTYIAGQAVVKVDNSTWSAGSYAAIGSYGSNGYMAGNADVTLQNGSTYTAGNLEIYEAEGKTVKVAINGSTLKATTSLSVFAGAEVAVNNGTLISSGTMTNNGTVEVTGESSLEIAQYAGNGWIYMDDATLDADTEVLGANVRFVSGNNVVDGAVIKDGRFQVGTGTYQTPDANVDTVNGVTVTVKNNAQIGGIDTSDIGAPYGGWVGSEYYDKLADKINAMTDARYTLNIENSIANFGYMHVSHDGILNVTGNADVKATYTGVDYSYYSGFFNVNGVATFDDVDVLTLFVNVSSDNDTENPGKLVIKNGTNFVSWRDSSTTEETFKISKTGIVEVDNATLDSRHGTVIAADASLIVKNDGTFKGNLVTNNGSISLDVSSTISFNSIVNAGTITIDMTDINNATGNKLFDRAETGWTVDNYKALVSNWNSDMDKFLTVDADGDLIVKETAVAYVNSEFTAEDLAAGNKFLTHDEAVNAGFERIITTGGDVSANVAHGDAEAVIEDGIFGGTVSGGVIINCPDFKQWKELTGDTSMSVAGGEFNKMVIGADRVDGGSAERMGDVNTVISNGTFNSIVAGGMLYAEYSIKGQAILIGDVNMVITGGEFHKFIYGGNITAHANYSSRTALEGNVSITIDASGSNSLSFLETANIIAGSYRSGAILGDTQVTVTGLGSNITWGDRIQVWGGCSGDYYDDNGDFYTAVSGSRTFSFDAFSGDFGATIGGFETLEVINDSDVNVLKGTLANVDAWVFEADSSLSGDFVNDFAGDTLNIDLGDWDGADTTLMSGAADIFKGIEDLASVTVGSETLTFDGVSKWASASYELSLEDGEEGKKVLAFSKLA